MALSFVLSGFSSAVAEYIDVRDQQVAGDERVDFDVLIWLCERAFRSRLTLRAEGQGALGETPNRLSASATLPVALNHVNHHFRRPRHSVNRRFEFKKCSPLSIGTCNKTLSVVAMCVSNPDRSPLGISFTDCC